MKVGGRPVLTIWSDALTRRLFDEVPAKFDSQVATENIALIQDLVAQIALGVGEAEGLIAHVPMERRTARAKAAQPTTDAFFERNLRLVNLGNAVSHRDARDSRGFGGTNSSDFSLTIQLGGATVKVDGTVVVDNGVVK